MAGWGTGAWGTSPWGGVDFDELGAPVLFSVTPTIVELLGGTVLTVLGEQFLDPTELLVLSGSSGSYEIVGRGVMADPEFDLREAKRGKAYTKVMFGLPAVDTPGTYHVQLIVNGAESNVLENVLDYRVHAEEYKPQKVRSKFGRAWQTAVRLLSIAPQGGR